MEAFSVNSYVGFYNSYVGFYDSYVGFWNYYVVFNNYYVVIWINPVIGYADSFNLQVSFQVYLRSIKISYASINVTLS
jgi:hypothetical protein